MKVTVLAAGTSSEREVSIKTGENISKALKGLGHNVILLDVFFGTPNCEAFSQKNEYDIDEQVKIMRDNTDVVSNAKERNEFFGENVIELCKESDIVFMALHGQNGEDGRIQAAFDMLGIKYTGTGHLGSALAMDKGIAKQILVQNSIPTPRGYVVTPSTRHSGLNEHNMTVPCVVKPCCGGSSIGVSIVKTEAEYEGALEEAFKYENEVIVEDYIEGREFSVGILENQALPIIEIIMSGNDWYDYENKYSGRTPEECPAKLDKRISKVMQEEALRVAKALKLEAYCRIDFLLDRKGEFYCLEANTLPGMTATSLLPQEAAVLGVEFPQLCEKLIEVSMKKYDV